MLEWIMKKGMMVCIGFIWLSYDPVTVSREIYDEPSGSISGGEFLG
jgi:hypothetical protein